MKKFLFICCCCFLLTVKVLGQQFSQYNTGTLFDSFENPAQKVFTPDTSKQFAFNFFIPNLSTSFFLAGDAQTALKTRAFSSYYNTAALQVGKGKYNHFDATGNAYTLMFKMFTSLDGNQEVGFFTGTKSQVRGAVTDETVALFNGYANFSNNTYSNLFNDNYFYQVYNQIGVSYREQVTKKFSVGFKISALSGIDYRQVIVNRSQIDFDKPNDQATVSLQGTARASETIGNFGDKAGLTFKNPGASISIGTLYVDENGYTWQGNIKDLGFIHWNKNSPTAAYSEDSVKVTGLSTPQRENNLTNSLTNITTASDVKQGFSTVTNGVIEISVNKSYWLDYDKQFKFSPTLIASKEMFYPGFTGALVMPVQYHSYIITLTSSYNDLMLFNFGGQFMIKTPNTEFFIGSEKLFQSLSLVSAAINSSPSTTQPQTKTNPGAFTGADFFIGASFKFGSIIEHPMNSSTIPNGEKGFIGRLYDKLFKKDKNYQ